MKFTYKGQVQADFDKARGKALLSRIFTLLRPEENQLFSFNDVKSILRPTSSHYRGIQAIKLSHIVGSEGRYQDFNKRFLPKGNYLRQRWERVNMAHYDETTLPPIKTYEIGGLYFVRDGNHRVSVAKSRGMEFIDAEVITLNSAISLTPDMTREAIMSRVIEFEKRKFFQMTRLDKLRPDVDLTFSSIGRYDDIFNHIEGHKYYLNLDKEEEIPFEEAMLSWCDHVYLPIVEEIKEEKMLAQFSGRTHSDLYVWICRHWDELKRCYGSDFPLKKAALDYTRKYGQKRITRYFRSFFRKLKRLFFHRSQN